MIDDKIVIETHRIHRSACRKSNTSHRANKREHLLRIQREMTCANLFPRFPRYRGRSIGLHRFNFPFKNALFEHPKEKNYTTWQDHTLPSTPRFPSPSSRHLPSCLPYTSKPKQEFKPSRLEIQHHQVPTTDVETRQVFYGILRIVDVFIYNKGRSSCFLRFPTI